jgi:hypothetical protein
MNRFATLLATTALGATLGICALDRAADAQSNVTVPRAFIMINGGNQAYGAPLTIGQPNTFGVSFAPANGKWQVAISGYSPAANGQPATNVLCEVTVATLQDAAALQTRITDPRTRRVGCTGTVGGVSNALGPGHMVLLDLTAPLASGQNFLIGAD